MKKETCCFLLQRVSTSQNASGLKRNYVNNLRYWNGPMLSSATWIVGLLHGIRVSSSYMAGQKKRRLGKFRTSCFKQSSLFPSQILRRNCLLMENGKASWNMSNAMARG